MKRYLLGWAFCWLALFAAQFPIAALFAPDGRIPEAAKPYVSASFLFVVFSALIGLLALFGLRGVVRLVASSIASFLLSAALLGLLLSSTVSIQMSLYATAGMSAVAGAALQWGLIALIFTTVTWLLSRHWTRSPRTTVES